MSSSIDQFSIFNDVPLAQILFKEINKNEKKNTNKLLIFEEDQFLIENILRVSLVNIRIRTVDSSNIPFLNLTYLNLSFNRISEINGIAHLTNLKVLDLSHNKIFDLIPIKKMNELEVFRAEHNLIESLKPLYNSMKIKQLFLSNNNIIWEELVYLENMNDLEIISIGENPLEKKQKIFDFLCAFKPSLKSVYGLKSVSDTILRNNENGNSNSKNNSNDGNNGGTNDFSCTANNRTVSDDILHSKQSDFLKASDGKLMITRGRAHFIKNNEKSDIKIKNERKMTLDDTTNSDANERTVRPTDTVRTFTSNKPLNSVKKEKKETKKEMGNTVTFPTPVSITEKLSSITNFSPFKEDFSENSIARRMSNSNSDKLFFESENVLSKPPSSAEHSGGHSSSSSSSSSVTESAGGTIRFGGNNHDLDAPIAFFSMAPDSGYVRYKNGITACTLENGKLLFSYKNGSIAGLLDASGNGSIMNPAGKCVLLLTNQDKYIAKIIDKIGQTTRTYEKNAEEKDKNGNGYHSSSSSPPKKSENISGFSGGEKAASHVWNFDGLKMEFTPHTWEIKISVKTDEVSCTFSSTAGCFLTKNNLLTSIKPSKSQIKKNVLSNVDHSNVRTGIQSVMSKLDDMMSDIKS